MVISRSRVPTIRKPKQRQQSQRDPNAPPPVTIGVVSGDLGRYTEFATSMMRLIRPPDTRVNWIIGLDVTANFNRIANEMLDGDESSTALWIMGDDHIFDPLLLIQLMAHDLDVVVPFCLERQAPFKPVAYSGIQGQDENGFDIYTVADLPQTGVHEIFAAGSAGMLIKRHVLEKIERPIFSTSGLHQNEDLNLCRKIREAGFRLHIDIDARLGHIGVFGIFPLWVGDRFGTALRSGDAIIPLYPYDSEEDAAA